VPRTFDCPKCGAPVNYGGQAGPEGFTSKCNYCGSMIAAPSMGRPAHVVHVRLDGVGPNIKMPKRVLLILILVPVFAVVGVVIAMIVGFSSALHTVSKPPIVSVRPTREEPKGGLQPDKSLATVLLKFGSKGIGPGMFNDARSIAVDAAGNIYVGEYSNGRIQVFDGTGKFITQWTADPKMPVRGLAADRKGTVYVVQSGKIQKYEGLTGNAIGEVQFSGGWGFDDIAPTASGGLVCAWYKNRDDIVVLDANGKVLKTIQGAISSNSDNSELDTRVATDGLGNIYALGTFNNAVFKFGPDGKYINRFGGDGDQPGQFRAPQSIAVDGRGRVYVSDIKGIQRFDADGRYLDTFRADGSSASGMVFNDKNELFVVAREKVIKVGLKD
jgi:DNA-binding beta-propeller fold protein YncE